MTRNINLENLKMAISPYDMYCEGYGNSGSSGNCYILGLVIGVGKSDIEFSHPGSQMLDEINAFDLAEIDGPYIGQLNMSIVSSFCGPQGLVWGYDVVPDSSILNSSLKPINTSPISYKNKEINIYDANVLIEATTKLLGTVDNRKFILRPGAHVPFAGKTKIIKGEGIIYSAIALGIPKDRQHNACLLLEDTGMLHSDKVVTTKETVFSNLAKSIIRIGINQNVEYTECFVAIRTCEVGHNQIGCALVAAPYMTLANNALLKNNAGAPEYEKMFNITISDWQKTVAETYFK